MKTFIESFNWNEFTVIFDNKSVLCLILVNWEFNYKFNKAFLEKFDDFELYDINWKLNIKIAEWITNNLHYYL